MKSLQAKPKTIRILKRDLDAAIKGPWSTTTCLIAQVGKRVGLLMYEDIEERSSTAHSLMCKFDNCSNGNGGWYPERLAELRRTLPITVNLE